MAWNNRQFGVEIECKSNGFGISGTVKLLRDNGLNDWASKVYEDGSEVELPSPILKGPEGLGQVKKVMDLLVDNGFTTTTYDGMHVHHDVDDLNLKQLLQIFKSWQENQEEIEKIVQHQRRNGEFCQHLTRYDLEYIERNISANLDTARTDKYRGMSLYNHAYSRTVEIRLHEGTLNFENARAWILFGQAFITNVAQRSFPLPKLPLSDLLHATKTYKIAHKPLLEKAGITV